MVIDDPVEDQPKKLTLVGLLGFVIFVGLVFILTLIATALIPSEKTPRIDRSLPEEPAFVIASPRVILLPPIVTCAFIAAAALMRFSPWKTSSGNWIPEHKAKLIFVSVSLIAANLFVMPWARFRTIRIKGDHARFESLVGTWTTAKSDIQSVSLVKRRRGRCTVRIVLKDGSHFESPHEFPAEADDFLATLKKELLLEPHHDSN